MRLLSAIACELDLDVCHFDVEQAFVQSKLDEDVFMRLPRGCGRLSGKVVRLNKSLYGLKQASRSWHAHLTTCLNTLGFQQCLADACVFRLVEEGRVAIIAVVQGCPRLSSKPLLYLYLVSVRYLVPYVLDANNEWYIKYVCLYTSGSYITPT